MDVTIIIIGIGDWDKYTKPYIESIQKYEPDTRIIIVDNGGNYWNIDGYYFVHTGEIIPYSKAINFGIRHSTLKRSDWTIITNNDVLCTGPFFNILESLDKYTLYGPYIHPIKHKRFTAPTVWVDGWMYIIPTNILLDIGYWDPCYQIAAFEDADYSFRAHQAGYKIKEIKVPFKHLESHNRRRLENFKKEWEHNINYLVKKWQLK